MSSSEQVSTRLMTTLQVIVPVSNRKQLVNWAWIAVAIFQAKSIALSQLAVFLPGSAKAESRVMRRRRWLSNQQCSVWALYRPLLVHVLAPFAGRAVYVILDGTLVFGNRMQIFRLSLVHKNRAIPLVWKVIPGKGNTRVGQLEGMLTHAAEVLNGSVASVTLLADRGFRDHHWATLCLRLDWQYVLRLPANTWVNLPDGGSGRIDQLAGPQGRRRFYPQVTLTKQAALPTALSVGWTQPTPKQPAELIAVISDQPAGPARRRAYSRRMLIEQSFKEDQSGGFDLDHTRVLNPQRLERLLLAVALATLWAHELGEYVLRGGPARRQTIDAGTRRELSLFQLGLRWLKRCIALQLQRLPAFKGRLAPTGIRTVVKTRTPTTK